MRWYLFLPKDKYLIVHRSDINPCEYVLAILKGKGRKDYDIIKSFGEMIRREIKITAVEKQSSELPHSPEEIVERLRPLPEIYNTIFYTSHGKHITNKYWYAKTESSQLSTKIWSMACDWEALLKKEKKCKASTYWIGNP